MKILPIKKTLLFFALLTLISCYHSQPHIKVLDGKGRKAVLGEDYTIEKYKSKQVATQITFQIVDDLGKEPDTPFYIEYNGMLFFDKPIVTFRVFSDRKYNFSVGSRTSQTIEISNITPQLGDSIIVKVEVVNEGEMAHKKIRFKKR
ncbi:hypothetical protein [Capnocytophaga sp. HP1101]